jgi:phosphoserine aminotransferase
MVPMNLVPAGSAAGYVRSGAWGKAAYADGARAGSAYLAWDGQDEGYTRMPRPEEIEVRADARYVHVTSNETIEGIRMTTFPDLGVPLVADMSSDYLSRRVPWELFDVVYGGVQKNLGPAGLAVVVIRSSLLASLPEALPSYLRLAAHADKDSLLNTPAMFSIYVMGKVLRWIGDQGGVDAMTARATARSGAVYEAIEGSGGFYRSPVEARDRSLMNVVFRTGSDELDSSFLKGAEQEGLVNLKGHRSVGGMRASIYNAMTDEGVDALVAYMAAFAEANA